ncbi:HAD-IA family hydrolase [Streptomyces abikoensis]|uniref:HAD-IA family hydrolase n=1 Tax=Streptomyces abikoensis TaxID=97398 RepID=A0ABW7TF64_9ACTN
MTTNCIIFDIGGVLEITPETGWVQRWEERLELPPGTVNERMRDVWRAGSVGSISEAEVYKQVAARLGLGMSQVETFMDDLWAEYLGMPNQELIDYVRGLRGSCRLGILSNSFVGAREREAALYLRAFEAACAGLEVRPESCLFIDDVAANIEAARAAGMQAHLFEDNDRAIKRIMAHLGTGSLPPSHAPLG